VPRQIILKQLNGTSEKKISPELRAFALTLNFYSSSAYNYVRKVFNKSLPHPSTIRKWYAVINGSPGFTTESLNALHNKVSEMKLKNKQLICGMMMDEVSIKQDVHFNGKRNQGYVNYGTGLNEDTDSLPLAKEALVLMLVALNSNWKIPIGYFLINGMSGEEKANLVRTSLNIFHETGVIVKSLTFDGAGSNISMATSLGSKLHPPNVKTYFLHPITKSKIFIFLDPCHMLKLCRNTLGDWKSLYDKNGQEIKWELFEKLVKLQDETQLHLATKIRARHINYYKEKMKVRLAAQTLSESVSKALIYCSNQKIQGFQNSDATSTFCQQMNDIFDLLNTRNFLDKTVYKKPIYKKDETFLKLFTTSAIDYLESLQTRVYNKQTKSFDFIPVINSGRKTGFNGLIVCLKSIIALFDDVIKTDLMDFILSYKISQDHIEMFFSAIRSRGGFCNNPTASQFESAYKRLLIHTEITTSIQANCMRLDETEILTVTSSSQRIESDSLEYFCTAGIDIDEEEDTSMFLYLEQSQYTSYLMDTTQYISGFVVRKITKIIKCQECAEVISESSNTQTPLIDLKTRGGLIRPNDDVTELCRIGENVFRIHQHTFQSNSNNATKKFIIKAFSRINISKYFLKLSNHIYNQNPINNHLIQIIKLIFKSYFTIRIHHLNKTISQPKERIRSHFTKLVHFQHQ